MGNINKKNNLAILYCIIQHLLSSSNRSRNIFQLSAMTLFLTFSASTVFAVPDISSVTQTANSLKITGLAFGTKPTPAPVYWNNLENETASAKISGWNVIKGPGGIISNADKWSGNQSLYFAMKSSNPISGWNEILKDLGASKKWYFHFKVRFNKNDSNTQLQWKSWRISSSSDGYAWNAEATTTVFMNDLFWYDENHAGSKGWNGPSGVTFNNGGTSGNSANSYFTRSDAILSNQWQTLEQYIQQSSTGPTPDGINKFWRDGILVQNNTSLVTGTSSSGIWRYMMLGQNINSTLPVALQMDVDIYYDDIYIDNTQARVMICDTPLWADRTQCEIQPPTDWQDGQIAVDYNLGKFKSGQKAYIYVVDSNGVVNSIGSPFTIGAPAPPKGNVMEKYIP